MLTDKLAGDIAATVKHKLYGVETKLANDVAANANQKLASLAGAAVKGIGEAAPSAAGRILRGLGLGAAAGAGAYGIGTAAGTAYDTNRLNNYADGMNAQADDMQGDLAFGREQRDNAQAWDTAENLRTMPALATHPQDVTPSSFDSQAGSILGGRMSGQALDSMNQAQFRDAAGDIANSVMGGVEGINRLDSGAANTIDAMNRAGFRGAENQAQRAALKAYTDAIHGGRNLTHNINTLPTDIPAYALPGVGQADMSEEIMRNTMRDIRMQELLRAQAPTMSANTDSNYLGQIRDLNNGLRDGAYTMAQGIKDDVVSGVDAGLHGAGQLRRNAEDFAQSGRARAYLDDAAHNVVDWAGDKASAGFGLASDGAEYGYNKIMDFVNKPRSQRRPASMMYNPMVTQR